MTKNIEQLRKDEAKLDKAMKAAAQRSLRSAVVKYPIKDEELLTSPHIFASSPPLPVPQPKYPFNIAPELFGDVISVWEFLNTFRYV